ncbi:MAG TPA: type II toxin-antitoxin system RelE/ParE family toxin [Pyrinomonadaceae bacterium]|nr:type II toxin-antitoxin system RelE/ParE family toxin [Pyrinomonadaceae bacterium]
MKKYSVRFHPDAESDITSSYQWGSRVWGPEKAKAWLRQLRHAIQTRLTSLPLTCPLAPESEDLDVPIRQLIVQRYRILFIVEKKEVTILHVRGPYIPKLRSAEVVDE